MVKRLDRLIKDLAVSAVSQVLLTAQGLFPTIHEIASPESIGQHRAPSKAEALLPPSIFRDVAAPRGLTDPHISSPLLLRRRTSAIRPDAECFARSAGRTAGERR
jgi:hypothetical protein